jgi:4-alpha-glucanotransferase
VGAQQGAIPEPAPDRDRRQGGPPLTSRRAGVLLHPTSLPGPHGAGDLGPSAREWLDRLAAAGARIWQVLPLQPADHGCPYASPSAFALEPLLLSLDDLVADGWLTPGDIPRYPASDARIDHGALWSHRRPLVELAASRAASDSQIAKFLAENPWLDAWSVFRALQQRNGPDWTAWPAPWRDAPLEEARAAADPELVAREAALQWLVDVQWRRLRSHAHQLGVKIWGDLPIFVGLGACDVWAERRLWRLKNGRTPTFVSAVPPDLFSPLGQRWGHPLYDVAEHRRTNHRWWVDRARVTLSRNDIVRIDHFRGLESWWQVPASAPDARQGKWVPGLGAPLLNAFRAAFGERLPFVAEDLGVITPEVEALRDAFGLPGMAVLQFAWDDEPDNQHHPRNHRRNQVCYSGTHDTDTAFGWAASLPPTARDETAARMGCRADRIGERLIELCWASIPDTAIIPAQDVLHLGSEARTNVPGTTDGNWSWRLQSFPDGRAMRRLEDGIRAGRRAP